MKIKWILISLGIICFTIALCLAVYNTNYCWEEREAPCVDGDGDMNLEGIICMKKINTCGMVFDFIFFTSLSIFFTSLSIGTIFIMVGVMFD